jgi:adenylate kinase family enzyme
MERVLVIGSCGAGKSTVARQIAARTGLPLVHLDRVFWRPGWVPVSEAAFDAELAKLLAEERWVMDGNYSRTMPTRMAVADTVVFLDVPRRVCLFRVARRQLTYLGRSRPDMTPGCRERINAELLRWIWTYPTRRRAAVLERLADFERRGGTSVVLRNATETNRFLAGISRESGVRSASKPVSN